MIKVKTYENGLRLIVNSIDCVRSVSMGILVGAGSRLESDNENGISHFIEHVSFKGTTKRTSFDISDQTEGLGAQINAFTSKDVTCYYIKCTDEHVEECFDILSDLFLDSVYPEDELNKERGVVLEEINMAEDTPDDLCIDLLAKAYFGEGGYGSTILGPAENVSRFNRNDVFNYRKKYYVPSNTVISLAGNVSFEKACALIEEYFGMYNTQSRVPEIKINTECLKNNLSVNKPIEQNHIAFGIPGVGLNSPEKPALICLNAILGGGMSSRLFQTVREKAGLAYSVYSYLSCYNDLGVIYVYAGVNPKKLDEACECISEQINLLGKQGISERELIRVKEQIKGSTVLSSESTASLMISQAKKLLLTGEIFNIDKDLENLSNLKLDDVNELAKEYFSTKTCASAIVGKNVSALKL